MPGASLALFADLGACHVQKSSVTICVPPTPFRWRATPHLALSREFVSYFYPRPPGGGRHEALKQMAEDENFYPRPPGGGRPVTMLYALADQIFLSTPSGWRATALQAAPDWCGRDFYPRPPGGGRRSFGFDILDQDVISIHALRVEGDTFSMIVLSVALNFYPRPPGGGRPGIGRRYQRFYEISIHALRVEGDRGCG